MASEKYIYSIQNDTPNHKVDSNRLTNEIRASSIITALDYIGTDGDELDIWMKATLSTEDEATLDYVVAHHSGEPYPQQTDDVNIKSSITLPSQEKGFQDLTGHNVYRFGPSNYLCTHGTSTLFHEKFSSTMYIQGGGLDVPEYVYVSGTKTDNKPEQGDYCTFDLVDIDNILGYGKTATVAKVARSSNVATITTTAAHTFIVGDKVCVNTNDDTFDDMEETIASVPDNTHFTYVNTGDDVTEKDATGSVGKIVVLAPFVPKAYIFAGQKWECSCSDAKTVPPGIYLRFRYVSVGSSDVYAIPHYKLRT